MKKIRTGLFCVLLCLLTGCAGKKESAGYQIYYANTEATGFLTENWTTQKTDALEIVWAMLAKMKNVSAATEQKASLFPDGVSAQSVELTDGQLTVTFNDAYSQMDADREILLRAGLVKTVTQVSGVERVVFHIGSDVLKDSSGEPVGAMTAAMFLTGAVGYNSYQYASLSLYFSNKTGDKVVRELRNVHYSSNTTLEKVVMEQLLKGPTDTGLSGVFPDGTRVLGVSVDDGECTLNLSQEFLEKDAETQISAEVVLYSIVNSLCDVCGADSVQFQVNGESDIVFWDEMTLAGPFHRNSKIIETSGSNEEEEQQTIAEPSIGL